MGGRVGKAADLAREQKLPSVAAIEAMAHVFTHATEPVELYVGSALALLHCAPQRINETVRLSALCEAEALDTEGNVQYGLRWPGSKGFENSVKWIVPTMSPVARRAVSNLKAASAEARTIAAWYEQNPTAVYLPDRLAYLRKQDRLSLAELSSALYGSDDKIQSAMAWCTREKVPRKGGTCKFSDVEAAVIAMLPPEFPYAQPNLKFSDALFAVRKFELDAQLFTYACLVDYLSSDQISSRLTSRSSVAESVFERFHLTEDDGKPIKLKTHQVRHYLNTLAQANGVSQLDIAMWSGRADVAQNKAYDHVTADQLLSKAVDLAVSSNSALFGGDLDTPKPRVLATRDAVGNLQNSTAHITDYGMCTHDYAASPCHIHLDCLNCNELVCVKGDRVKTGNIRRLKDETEELLRQAEIAERSETYGASRWVEHQRKTLEHCTQLINILDNPAVKTGALVKLAGIQPASRIAQAAAERSGATTIALPQRINKLLERVKRG
jgi:hypothetical protein